MSREIINTILLAGMFLSLFAIAEILYYKLQIKAASTRQLVHIGTGLLGMLFPLMLGNHWFVLLLCATFATALFLSLKFNLLRSINAIDRVSYGSLLYPVAVYGCYLVYNYSQNNLLLFYLPLLTMAICDPVAAIFGQQWPYGKFHIRQHTKTVIGSLAFFLSSAILTVILFYFFSPGSFYVNNVLPIAFLIAGLTTLAEAFSINGLDNITIPLCVVLALTLVHA